MRFGRSRLPITIEMFSYPRSMAHKALAQFAQLPRLVFSDDWKNLSAVSLFSHANASRGNSTHARVGAPLQRRQTVHEHRCGNIGCALAIYLTSPHKQPPLKVFGVGNSGASGLVCFFRSWQQCRRPHIEYGHSQSWRHPRRDKLRRPLTP